MKPRLAFFDIETAPSKGYFFELYKEGNIVWTEEPWYILSFAWKWQGENQVHSWALPNFPRYVDNKEDDKELVKKLWKLFDEADILVAHHGDNFDIKKANTRFLMYGMKPPTPYRTVDTRKEARKRFGFDSNKLNDLGQALGVGRKLKHTGYDLWRDCMNGDMKAWRLMIKYNKQDVVLLEKVYQKVLGWIGNHPALSLEKEDCPNCGKNNTEKRGIAVTRTTKKQRYHCIECGAWWQGKIEKT